MSSSEPFVIEGTFDAPIAMVWKAITDKDEMKKWYFDLKEFEPVKGFEFQFEGGPDERKYLHCCKIIEVNLEKTLLQLEVRWIRRKFRGDL